MPDVCNENKAVTPLVCMGCIFLRAYVSRFALYVMCRARTGAHIYINTTHISARLVSVPI